jgi:hypothetical protein
VGYLCSTNFKELPIYEQTYFNKIFENGKTETKFYSKENYSLLQGKNIDQKKFQYISTLGSVKELGKEITEDLFIEWFFKAVLLKIGRPIIFDLYWGIISTRSSYTYFIKTLIKEGYIHFFTNNNKKDDMNNTIKKAMLLLKESIINNICLSDDFKENEISKIQHIQELDQLKPLLE